MALADIFTRPASRSTSAGSSAVSDFGARPAGDGVEQVLQAGDHGIGGVEHDRDRAEGIDVHRKVSSR